MLAQRFLPRRSRLGILLGWCRSIRRNVFFRRSRRAPFVAQMLRSFGVHGVTGCCGLRATEKRAGRSKGSDDGTFVLALFAGLHSDAMMKSASSALRLSMDGMSISRAT